MRSATSCSASASRAHWVARSTRVLDVDRLEQLELLLGREVTPRAEAVGERAGLGRRAEQLGQPTGATALTEHRQHAAQLAAELGDRLGGGRRRRPRGPRPRAPPRCRPHRHRAGPGAGRAGSRRRRRSGSSPDSSTCATVPTRAKRPSIRGTSSSRPSAPSAAATAARASSVSSVRVATVLGSTTPVSRGSTGRRAGCPARASGFSDRDYRITRSVENRRRAGPIPDLVRPGYRRPGRSRDSARGAGP